MLFIVIKPLYVNITSIAVYKQKALVTAVTSLYLSFSVKDCLDIGYTKVIVRLAY